MSDYVFAMNRNTQNGALFFARFFIILVMPWNCNRIILTCTKTPAELTGCTEEDLRDTALWIRKMVEYKYRIYSNRRSRVRSILQRGSAN